MQKRVFLLTMVMLLFYSVMWSQTQMVSGTVYDDTGAPLPGASVIVKGSRETQLVGTITDMDGRYSLAVDDGDVLVFSFIGFEKQEVPVQGKEAINVTLQSSAAMLEDVVVVGYGIQKKASVVGSISQVDGEDLLEVGSPTNISQAIQGLMPGVISMSETGKPGADQANILIRGKASWQETDPLVLVDGIERDMNDVDPNEIENISVLKDASATAVYGAKGANGVILITTKRGKEAAPEINFSANFGFKLPSARPEFSDYPTALEMRNESLMNDQRYSELIPQSIIEEWRENLDQAGPYNDYFPNVNWWDQIVDDAGYQQQYNINVRGGTKFVKYFASLGYLNDGDIFKTKENDLFDPSFYYERYNWRSNFDFDITETTRLSANVSGSLAYRNQPGYRINDGDVSEDGWGQAQFFEQLYTAGQNEFPVKWSDGEWGVSPEGGGNLLMDFDKGQRSYRYYKGFLDFLLDQKLDFIIEGLTFNGKLSYNSRTAYSSRIQRYQGGNFGDSFPVRYSREWDYTNPNPDGTYPLINEVRWPDANAQNPPPSADYDILMNKGFTKSLYYELALNYSQSFGNHNVSALALFSRREDEGLANNSSNNIQIPSRREDYVGRITYNWKERYLMELNGAYNGSEKFARGQRFGFFPSLSAGWRISEEPFIQERLGSFLENLKVRYSYGQSGYDNVPGNRFAYIQTYNSAGNLVFGFDNPVPFGPRYVEGDAANPNATWETATKQNFGVEMNLWGKLNFTMDVFKERRTGILMNVWSPLWLGVSEPSGNIGETKNQGVEFELGWREKIGANFNYWVKGNVSFNENRIVYRNDGANVEPHLREAGKPIDWQSRYLVHDYYQDLDDVFNYAIPGNRDLQSGIIPGDFMFVDYNGDGVIDQNDQVVMEEVTHPLHTYALSFGFKYKNLSMNARFYGVSDISKNVDGVILYDLWDAEKGIIKAGPEVLGRWTPENADNAVKPVLHASSSYGDYSKRNSSYGFRDHSYVRLKNVEINYTFQNLGVFGLSRLQVYANGDNLWTITDLDDRMDPETGGAGVYPIVKRYNLGFRARF
ncbi:SusC/RagA family TonB-linked outer membrane protein [Marinilabilia rubra]|uniref:TonB-dependent receptor n=1 Tax=Marinilabilia rubra TaxID=2162893 RepID=A0A2U2BE74_9BACT|nr:TonB-dependent receptor [Marinilabilia rubra]PWE01376.1 TonB-dependent receptor [Marinilabilia rubra]